jgi:hypothetical protein
MEFNPKRDLLGEQNAIDQIMLHRLFTQLIFDALVRAVVRDHYGFHNPRHITFQVDHEEAVLFVWEGGRAHLRDDDLLLEWAYDFIVREVMEMDASSVSLIYLDGTVDSSEPYLYIAGGSLVFASGEPARKGKYLL